MSFNLQVFLFYSLPIIFALLVSKLNFSSKKSHKNLPPSPPRLPLIGNLHQLGAGIHRVLQSMAKTYGPLILLHFGTVPVIVASSVDAAREIMKTHDITFANRPYLNTISKLSYDGKDIAFSKYGEQWRQLKSISVLHLLSNKRVQSYRKVREEEVVSMIKKIQGTNESIFNLSELVATLTHNVISRAALGKIYEGMELKHLLDRTFDVLGRFCFASVFPSLAWMDRFTGLEREIEKLAKDIDEFYDVVIDEHVNKKEGDAEGQDLKKMIKALILEVFNGGTDTTSTSLDWAIGELLQNPHTMKKLQQEAHTVGQGREMITEDDLDNMPYLKAVLKEALRLHIPAPLLVPRESTKDVKLLGYDIPSGSQVMINAWAIARDPLIWEEPEEFRPERFLNTATDYKGFHFEFIPFGAGRRGCPGISFAMIINEIVLANLVYKFEFSLLGNEPIDMTESDGLTVHRKFPILVKATPRE
ncbi:putative cytochrome P450 [Helianthus annuus]|nr:putative cytochrome P450 [Helianthus annuus]